MGVPWTSSSSGRYAPLTSRRPRYTHAPTATDTSFTIANIRRVCYHRTHPGVAPFLWITLAPFCWIILMPARCDACHGILAVAQPSAHTIQAACDARETPVCPLSLDLAYKQKLHAGADEALQKLTTLSGEETRLSVINELG